MKKSASTFNPVYYFVCGLMLMTSLLVCLYQGYITEALGKYIGYCVASLLCAGATVIVRLKTDSLLIQLVVVVASLTVYVLLYLLLGIENPLSAWVYPYAVYIGGDIVTEIRRRAQS